jgi:Arc/MetJ-type ribon-helix-helix transcriptional regulator
MSIELSDDLEEYARQKVASGAYADTEALLQAALREKMIAEQVNAEELEALRVAILPAIDQMDRGIYADFDPDRINRELDEELGG